MLELLLTAADGGTSWRHLLASGRARAGWECVGPHGLARRLGRLLGFPCDPAPALDRLAAYLARAERLDDGNRSYSASRRADRYGVAAHLLALREELLLAGWDRRPVAGSPRLADLSALEALDGPPLAPGFAEVVAALTAEVRRVEALPVPVTVRLAAPREGFAPVVLSLLEALAQAGAAVVEPEADAPRAPAGTDLHALQRALLQPEAPRAPLSGDGSLLVLEAETALEAAEVAAAVLRGEPGEERLEATTVVACAEAGALDAALFRQGLPTLGLASTSRFRPHLQVLPLRLDLAFHPRDPFRAAELLLLPGGPLAAQVRRKLLSALSQMPGIGSPAWREAVAAAVAEAEARARADGAGEAEALKAGRTTAERIDTWFPGSGAEAYDPAAGIPAAAAAGLCSEVASWAGARSGGAEADGDAAGAARWAQAAAVARRLERILRGHAPADRIPQRALAQLHDLAVGDGADADAFAGEAGRSALCADPGAVLPGARTVLWFGFVKDAGPGASPSPWSEPERAALAQAGVQVAAAGARRRFEAWGWRRPLLEAGARAVLVRWRLAGSAPVPAHALLDELATRTAPGALEACTFDAGRLLAGGAGPLRLPVKGLAPAAPIAPRPIWKVPPGALAPASTLSYSTLDSLLGCPFRWALEHQAGLRPGRALQIPDDRTLLGDFAHRLLQDLVKGERAIDLATATPEDASRRVLEAFDARVAEEAAPLVRQGREVERDAARTLVAGAAAALVRHLQAGRWRPREVEEEVQGTFAGKPVHGYVDLTLTKPGQTALLDLKLSGGKRRRAELEEGHALQLALYAHLLRQGGAALPPAGFLTLDDGQLLTIHPQSFPGATVVEGPSAEETLDGAETMLRYWERVFAEGLLPVCSEDLQWQEPVAAAAGALPGDDTLARREPPCFFCTFKTLCRAEIRPEVSP